VKAQLAAMQAEARKLSQTGTLPPEAAPSPSP
jgi:hypothetical protein